MTEPQFWPDCPLFTDYLAAAHADHAGHRLFDAACLFSLLQLYANRSNIVFGGRAFRVHFFLLGETGNEQSAAMNFAFGRFFPEYQNEIGHDIPQVMYLGGQNTAAGLIDAFNGVEDPYKRQVAMFWAHDAARLFFTGRYKDDLISFFDNVLSGLPNVRRVRERVAGGNAGQTVARPIINAVVPARYDQIQETFATESTLVFNRFMLVSAGKTASAPRNSFIDRLNSGGAEPALLASAIEKFQQYANFIEMSKGTNIEPARIGITPDAQSLLFEKFRVALSKNDQNETMYFRRMTEPITLLVGLNALARFSLLANVEDVERAWAFGLRSYEASVTTIEKTSDDSALSPVQKQRYTLTERLERAIRALGKEGITRTELRKKIGAFRAFTQTELDEFFMFVEQEVTSVFSLRAVQARSNGSPYTAIRYFHTDVWSREEAVQHVHLEKPHWSSASAAYIDALGGIHPQLKDCAGYREEWESQPKVVRDEASAA